MPLFAKKENQQTQTAPETNIVDIIAPAGVEFGTNYFQLEQKFGRTIFVFNYPQILNVGWLSPVITLDKEMNVSMFIHPLETAVMLKDLTKKTARVQSQISLQAEAGKVRDPLLEAAIQNIEGLRDQLQQGASKLFKFGLYITFFADSAKELNDVENEIRALLETKQVYAKPAIFQQEQGFVSSLPVNQDQLGIHTGLDSGSLSTTFPFISSDLSDNKGILYGVNRHNNSLILFDRFSLENANTVVFAKSGAGKSIAKREPVLIKDKKGTIKLKEIGVVVEKLIKRNICQKIDDDLEGVIDPGIFVYTFNKKMKGEWSPVSVAARKEAPKTLYKFTTASGREITTTGDHNMLVLRNGKVIAAKSAEVKENEYVPLSREIPEPEKSPKYLNLLKLLKNRRGIYVQGAAPLLKQNCQILKKARINLKLDRYLYQYRDNRSIPINYFWQILNYLKTKPNQPLLKKIFLNSGRHKNKKEFILPALFEIKSEFLRILGYIASEGAVQKDIILISNTDPEIIKDIEECLDKIGVGYHYRPWAIAVSSRTFVELIKTVGLNGKSDRKKVPPFVFNLGNKKTAEFLKSYFEGDGGVERSSVAACSKSQKLISELSYLLLRYGIISRIKPRRKTATNSGATGIYWHLTISGQKNLKHFAQKIGFVSLGKQRKLAGIINKKFNTNVDIVPTVDILLKEIYQLFKPDHQYFQLSGIRSISPLRRGIFNPSTEFLKETIIELEQRLENLKQLAPQINNLGTLPSLASIIEQGENDKSLNGALWQELGHSWRLMKNQEVNPGCQNVFRALQTISGCQYNLLEIKNSIWSAFKDLGISMKECHPHLRSFLVDTKPRSSYAFLKQVSDYLIEKYLKIGEKIAKAEEKINTLKTLADSDLFWDPIVKIEKIRNKDKYVYDLTVDNEVFLAGQGGMFVHNSYAVKLEVLRSLMHGADVIIVDPEKEYKYLSETVGGSFIDISLMSPHHLNPFDLPLVGEDENPADVLKSNVLNLVGLLKIMLGGLTPEEDAILDKALTETYASRDITEESDFNKITPPLMQDLYAVLAGMTGAEKLATRLEKFVSGTYAGFFNQPTNVRLDNQLVVFSIRDMEEELRPLAMYIILNYIWNIVRSERKKRIMVVDEAWWMMQHDDAASFLFGIAKRCRKYYLGLTTITQDVGDFMKSKYGKAIVTNSSLQLLMKQSPATIDIIQETFRLTEEEKLALLKCNVGEGIFFAGLKHAAIQVVASYTEDQIITSDPAQLLEIEQAKKELAEEE